MISSIKINQTYKINKTGLRFNKSVKGTADEMWSLPSYITVQSKITKTDMYLVSLMNDDTIRLAYHTIEDYYE